MLLKNKYRYLVVLILDKLLILYIILFTLKL
jgi:hypothetical protein